jgi:hypothetical protein
LLQNIEELSAQLNQLIIQDQQQEQQEQQGQQDLQQNIPNTTQ